MQHGGRCRRDGHRAGRKGRGEGRESWRGRGGPGARLDRDMGKRVERAGDRSGDSALLAGGGAGMVGVRPVDAECHPQGAAVCR